MALRTILLCVLAAGCANWHAQPLTPQQVISEMHPKRIRVTLTDSSVLELKHPVTSGDSIAGKINGTRTAVAADRIARTEVRVRNEPQDLGFLYSWRTERRAPQHVISKKRPDRIRVTLADSSVLVLHHPVIRGDSIVGMVSGTRTAVASDRIARTELRLQNGWKTLGFVSLYAVLYFSSCRGTPDCPRSP
jgi:hypothetical protein